jgi:small conductance mechanosensitive channel
MIESFNLVLEALKQLWVQMVVFVPKVIIAIVIWFVGKYLINLGVVLIRKIDIKALKIDNYLVRIFSSVILVVGKILLILVILDFLGIGSTILGAIANGLTLTVAIVLGLSFGRALEGDAKEMVQQFKKHLGKK